MLREVLIVNLMLCPLVILKRNHNENQRPAVNLIAALKNDANLDFSMDEEYEDLRAELRAYQTALASLAEDSAENLDATATPQLLPAEFLDVRTRRSMKTTPCWKMGGICVHYKLCQGHKSLTEIPGCKDKLQVCCFSWNKLETKDLRDKGISNIIFPWSNQKEIGGKGIIGLRHSKTEIESDNETPRVLQVFDIVDKERSKKEISKENTIHKKKLSHRLFNENQYKEQYRRKYDNKQKSPTLLILKS